MPIEGAGHNDLFSTAGLSYLQALGERMKGWVAAPGSPGPA